MAFFATEPRHAARPAGYAAAVDRDGTAVHERCTVSGEEDDRVNGFRRRSGTPGECWGCRDLARALMRGRLPRSCRGSSDSRKDSPTGVVRSGAQPGSCGRGRCFPDRSLARRSSPSGSGIGSSPKLVMLVHPLGRWNARTRSRPVSIQVRLSSDCGSRQIARARGCRFDVDASRRLQLRRTPSGTRTARAGAFHRRRSRATVRCDCTATERCSHLGRRRKPHEARVLLLGTATRIRGGREAAWWPRAMATRLNQVVLDSSTHLAVRRRIRVCRK